MNPDLEKRVPREILAELIEEGTEAFRGILEKLFNVAMQLERSEFLGAEAYERTASRRGYRNGFKGKRIQTRVGELHLEIPQVRGLRFYPKSLERTNSPSFEPQLAHDGASREIQVCGWSHGASATE